MVKTMRHSTMQGSNGENTKETTMAGRTTINWTESVWNPVRGCSPASPGCDFCYAKRFARRFSGPGKPYEGLTRRGNHGPEWTGDVRLVSEVLGEPSRWRKPRRVFVNSMSDLFHPKVPTEFIGQVFDVIGRCEQHVFQVLTKRSGRLAKMAPELSWPDNLWMGVSVEGARFLQRVHDLQQVPAAVRFLSLEPLLTPLPSLNLDGIHWVIVGGESGPGARPMNAGWVREIRDQCVGAGVRFFFKQHGGTRKKKTGRILDGRTWDEMPVSLPAEHGPAAMTAKDWGEGRQSFRREVVQ